MNGLHGLRTLSNVQDVSSQSNMSNIPPGLEDDPLAPYNIDEIFNEEDLDDELIGDM